MQSVQDKEKVTFNKQIITQECFLNYCYAYVPFAPALFNSNIKFKRFRHVPKCKSKLFLASNKHHFTVEVRKYVSETNKKINSYRNLALQFSQPTEIQISSSLKLSLEYSKSEGFWALLS